MKQSVGRLRLILISLLALIVCATAITFIADNLGDKLTASAAVELEYDENGVAIIEDDDGSKGYFTFTESGSTVTLTNLSSEVYRALGASVDVIANVTVPFKLVVPKRVTNFNFLIRYCKAIQELVFPYDGNLKSCVSFNLLHSDNVTELYLPSSLTTFDGKWFIGTHMHSMQFKDSTGNIVTQTDNGSYKTVNGGEAVLSGNGQTLYWGSDASGEKLYTDAEYTAVKNIGERAYSYRGMSVIDIPSRVTSINMNAFTGCDLRYVYFDGEETGENVQYKILDNAIIQKSNGQLIFMGAGAEGVVTVPETVKYIATGALENNLLVNVKLPASLTNLGYNPFQSVARMDVSVADGNTLYYSKHPETGEDLHCIIKKDADGDILMIGTGLTDLSKLPESVTVIGVQAFTFCEAFKKLDLPEQIVEIRTGAFSQSGLSKIKIYNGVKFVGSEHFMDTPYYNDPANWDNGQIFYIGDVLISVSTGYAGEYTIRPGTKSVLGNAFKDCSKITKINIPEGLERINGSFIGCTSLKSIVIPDSVVFIDNSAFGGCTNLKQVILPDNTDTEFAINTFANYSGKIIAPNYEVYQSVLPQITANKNNLTYEADVTVKVGAITTTLTKLAGYTLSYKKLSGVWTNSEFDAAGLDLTEVEYWTINGGTTHYTTQQLGAYVAPKDGTAITLVAYNADDTTEFEATLIKPATANPSFTYGERDNFNPEEEFEGFSFTTMKITYTDAAGNESEQVPRNAGAYTVKVYPMLANWKDTGDDSAYTPGTLTVNPREAEITWTGVGESSLDFEYVYDGKTHLPSAYFVDVNGDKILLGTYISLADGDGKIAASYTANLDVPAGTFANYILTGAATQDFTVAQREIAVEWDEDTLFAFTSFDIEPKLKWSTDYNDGKFKVEYTLSAKEGFELTDGKAVMPGEYLITLTITGTGSGNYFIAEDSITFEFTVDQPDASIIYWEAGTEDGAFRYEYDGEMHLPLAYYIDPLDNEKTYLEEGILGGAYNAGVYTANISLWVLAKYNLNGQLECDFEIVKKQVNIEWDAEKLDFVYNGKLQKPVAYFTGVNGERIMLEIQIAEGDPVDVGDYTATVVMADFANYDIVGGDAAKLFSIEKKVLTAEWSGSEFTYTGEEQTATFSIAGYDGETSVEYYTLAGEKVEGVPVEVGTYVMKLSIADGNYQLKNSSYTFNIEPVASVIKPDGGINWLVVGLIIGVGTAALLGAVALIVALKRRGKAVAALADDDDDGFNDDFDGNDTDGFYETYRDADAQ